MSIENDSRITLKIKIGYPIVIFHGIAVDIGVKLRFDFYSEKCSTIEVHLQMEFDYLSRHD